MNGPHDNINHRTILYMGLGFFAFIFFLGFVFHFLKPTPPPPETIAERAHRESFQLQQLCIRKGMEPIMEGDVFKECKPRFTLHFRKEDAPKN